MVFEIRPGSFKNNAYQFVQKGTGCSDQSLFYRSVLPIDIIYFIIIIFVIVYDSEIAVMVNSKMPIKRSIKIFVS